jgi:hypothetical protein
MLSNTPVTQRDMTPASDVHASTICLTLKNPTSIHPETRRRILQVAWHSSVFPVVCSADGVNALITS